MKFELLLFLLLVLIQGVSGQLAAVYSDVARTNECSSWSSWGKCTWIDAKNKKPYLEQLTSVCQSHWFFKFVRRYERALNSFFDYLLLVMRSTKPCGLCSYKQSCGFGGTSQCNLSPFEIPGGRAIMPFFVSERVCNRKDLRGFEQTNSCEVDYEMLKRNGGECQLWPSNLVDVSEVEAPFRQQLNELKWYTCVSQTKMDKEGKKTKVCRCCCFPFRPDANYKCVHDPQLPPAPGMEDL